MTVETGSKPWRRVLRVRFKRSNLQEKAVLLRWSLRDAEVDAETEIARYVVDGRRMDEAVRDARQDLQTFATYGRLGLPDAKQVEMLKLLAKSGAGLFEALFVATSAEEQAWADAMLDWYRANVVAMPDAPVRVEFCNEARNPVWTNAPWNILFASSRVEPAPEPTIEALHARFWVIRHRVCAYEDKGLDLSRKPDPGAVQVDRSVMTWREMEFHAFIRGRGEVDVIVRGELQDFTHETPSAGAAEYPDAASHFYYLSRRDRDGDDTTTNDRLRAIELKDFSAQPVGAGARAPRRYLGLIDGTPVMAEATATEWYQAFQRDNWTVFIAVEADTTKSALDFFGVNIIARLIHHGPDLLEALDIVRQDKDVRPWGLLYSLYADPARIQLFPPPAKFASDVQGLGRLLEAYWKGQNQSHSPRD